MGFWYFGINKIKPTAIVDNYFFFQLPHAHSSSAENAELFWLARTKIRISQTDTEKLCVNATLVLPDGKAYAQFAQPDHASPQENKVAFFRYIPLGRRDPSGKIIFDNLQAVGTKQHFTLAGDKYDSFLIVKDGKSFSAIEVWESLSTEHKKKVAISRAEFPYSLDRSSAETYYVTNKRIEEFNQDDLAKEPSRAIQLLLMDKIEFKNYPETELGDVMKETRPVYPFQRLELGPIAPGMVLIDGKGLAAGPDNKRKMDVGALRRVAESYYGIKFPEPK